MKIVYLFILWVMPVLALAQPKSTPTTTPVTTAPPATSKPSETPASSATPVPVMPPPLSLLEFPMPFEQADTIFGRQHIITFRPYALEPTDEGLQIIGKVAGIINNKPSIIKYNRLVIQTFSCPNEIAAKPYIGACRGQWIVDFLEKVVLLSRTKCTIIEGGAPKNGIPCQGNSGAILYLKPQ